MYRHLLLLPDGRELFSGQPGQAAIQSVTVTESVNPGQELTPGGVCAAMLEATILSPGGLQLTAGQEVTLFRVDHRGGRTQVGIFRSEQPQRRSANVYFLTAYDRVSLLDRDVSGFLDSLTGWPYSLHTLAGLVCGSCGVSLDDSPIPNGSYQVSRFSAQGITGRQVLQWVAQAACRFCRATAAGTLEFAWYTENPIRLAPSDSGGIALTARDGDLHFVGADPLASDALLAVYQDGDLALTAAETVACCQGTLQAADYVTAPIEKVQLQRSAQDIGAIYPDDPAATNTLRITGNYLLTQQLEPVARTLLSQLGGIAYTPGTVAIPARQDIRAGDVVTVYDAAGRSRRFYVMTKTSNGRRDTLQCTGSPRRDSTTAVNDQSYRALSGKVLELHADVDGLRAENRDAAGNLAALRMQVDSIAGQVTAMGQTSQQVSRLEQTADALALSIQRIQSDGVSQVVTGSGYRFDDSGLTISRPGQEIQNLLDNTGMYVRRAGQVILQAGTGGVTAADVQVRNYLCLGSHARLEDYSDGADTYRTACFFLS